MSVGLLLVKAMKYIYQILIHQIQKYIKSRGLFTVYIHNNTFNFISRSNYLKSGNKV